MSTMGMEDYRRKTTYPVAGGYPYMGNYSHTAPHAQTLRAAQYLSAGNPMMQHGHGDGGVAALAQQMGATNLHSSTYNPPTNRSSQIPAASDYGGLPMGQNAAMYMSGGAPYFYSTSQQMSGAPVTSSNPASYAQIPYIQQSGYAGYGPQRLEHSPGSQAWTPRMPSDGSQVMPTLITPRRDSVSSNEEHLPGTPFTGQTGFGSNYGNGVAVFDRSPNGTLVQSATPSPSQYMGQYQNSRSGKSPLTSSTPLALQLLVQQDPTIPRAIPAPNSPMKPLDRCLENKNGETNVYIRGLLPETTDEMLKSWGIRFGDIISSKSIIDHKNNLCKGFGFIKYHNFDDAENCIRGFHYLGYEVSFARESFYAKLKKFADEHNTNLYVSNIPIKMNEHELSAVFIPFNVCSARILRDDDGNGRGVGFARFDSRDVCEEIIKKFNNTSVRREGGEEHLIQIRFADTHEQKMLKQQTAAARQFRAAEFEFGCMQAGRGHMLHPEPDRQQSVSPAAASDVTRTTNEFESYMQGNGAALPRQATGLGLHSSYLFNHLSLPAGSSTVSSEAENAIPQVKLPALNINAPESAEDEPKPQPNTPKVVKHDDKHDSPIDDKSAEKDSLTV